MMVLPSGSSSLVVAGDEGAPGLRLDRPLRLPDDVELAIGLDSPMNTALCRWWFFGSIKEVMPEALEGLASHRRYHLVAVGGLRLLDRLLPHVDADPGGFHRIVG